MVSSSPVPDSGVPRRAGYGARRRAFPYEDGNHPQSTTVGRTFIEPHPADQAAWRLRLKHSANRPWSQDKRIVLVDDSIVRGHQPRSRSCRMMRDAGAKEVHFRIFLAADHASRTITGIDTPGARQAARRHP